MPAPMVPTLLMLDMLDTHTAMVPTHTTTAMLDTHMLPQSLMPLPQLPPEPPRSAHPLP